MSQNDSCHFIESIISSHFFSHWRWQYMLNWLNISCERKRWNRAIASIKPDQSIFISIFSSSCFKLTKYFLFSSYYLEQSDRIRKTQQSKVKYIFFTVMFAIKLFESVFFNSLLHFYIYLCWMISMVCSIQMSRNKIINIVFCWKV